MRERFRRKLFQFHEGPIKTLTLSAVVLLCSRFNSMKVRLKPEKAKLDQLVQQFQFHEGPIKTIPKSCSCKLTVVSIP